MTKVLSVLRTGLALALAIPAVAMAADHNWKFFTSLTLNDKGTQIHRQFAEDVAKATQGRLKITVMAAGELPFRGQDVLRAVATRQIEMGHTVVGMMAGDLPQIDAFAMPFVCTSFDKFYDRSVPAIDNLVSKALSDKFKVLPLVHWAMPQQQIWLSKDVKSLEDLRGLKIRAWSREQNELMQRLGGSGVSISAAEVIPSLQRKIVDGAFTAALPASNWKIYEVAKFGYMVDMNLAYELNLVNQAALEALPQDVRDILHAKAREWTNVYRQEIQAADEQAREDLVAKGMVLRAPSPDDLATLQSLTAPISEAWAKRNGPIAEEMLSLIRETCS
ncbi:MAG: TRAP transporter substrate-binding protein DctP [Pusillimonas sp.]